MGVRLIWRESNQFSDTRSAIHFYQNAYQSKTPPRGLVWLVHGLGEHLGRYQEFALFLNQAGYDVAGIDLPGHGLSRKEGGQNQLLSIEEFIQEIKDSFKFLKQEYHSQQVSINEWFLLGHSMGALLSLVWTADSSRLSSEEPFAKKIVISAPPLRLKLKVPEWKSKLAYGLESALPNLNIDAGFCSSDLSYDEVIVEENKQDSMCFAKASPRLYVSMQKAKEQAWASANCIDVPALVVVGEDDPIVCPKSIQEYYEKLNTHKKFLCIKNSRHETLNELSRKSLYEGVINWIST